LAFDLHKWGYLPYEVACVLVRDAKAHRDTFATQASYLKTEERGVLAGGLVFAERGIELSRNFKALKELFDAVDSLPEDASDSDRKAARRFAVDRSNGSLVSTEKHDKIIQKRFYYDEIIDELDKRSFDELFGDEWNALTKISLNDEKSIVSPYLIRYLGGDEMKREMIDFE